MNANVSHKKILVAPLNWGLGHAARCIPVVEALLKFNFLPILASDGASLEFLKQQFPKLKAYELPSSSVRYAERASYLKIRLLFQVPRLLKAVTEERKVIAKIHRIEKLSGIISDNRFGSWLPGIPSVYITHQLQVMSGIMSNPTTVMHQRIISKFSECWVPDDKELHLAGKLSTPKRKMIPIKYIGILSRFHPRKEDKKWDVFALLSGPEPQRSILEGILLKQLKGYSGKCILIQGLIDKEQKSKTEGNVEIVNYMMQEELEKNLLQSNLVIARSGYSSIMDLYALKAKAILIPTPGQSEQEYLGKYLYEREMTGYCPQENFDSEVLKKYQEIQGFMHKKTSKTDLNRSLFDVFA